MARAYMSLCVHAFRSEVAFHRMERKNLFHVSGLYKSTAMYKMLPFVKNVVDQVGQCRGEVSISLNVCDNDEDV